MLLLVVLKSKITSFVFYGVLRPGYCWPTMLPGSERPSCFVVGWYEPDGSHIICKLDNSVSVVDGLVVMCEECIKEGAQHTALGDIAAPTEVEDVCLPSLTAWRKSSIQLHIEEVSTVTWSSTCLLSMMDAKL